MHTRRTEVSNRRFLVVAAVFLLISLIGSWFIGHAGARGVVQTIDTGYYNAEEMKQPVPMQENQWNNGTYSNTKVNKNNVVFDIRDRLTVGSDLTITVQGGTWDWPTGAVNGNKISYTNARGMVIYEDQDTFLKETIILNAPVRSIEWKLNLSMKPQSLGFQVETDGYSIRDPANEFERIKIPFPFVTDAEGTRRDLTYGWNNGQKLLSLNLDDSGLIYPLTIDPVYTVETAGDTGKAPILMINQSDYPMISYYDQNYLARKLAVNNSGTWKIITVANASAESISSGKALLLTDLPFIYYRNGNWYNVSWFINRWLNTTSNERYRSESTNKFGHFPTGQKSDGTAFYTSLNNTNGNFNITMVTGLDTITPTFYPRYIVSAAASGTLVIGGGKNASDIVNIIYALQYDQLNWTTSTIALSPTIQTWTFTGTGFLNQTGSNGGLGVNTNPITDFPGISYKPYQYANGVGAGKTDGRAVNYSYFDPTTNKWYHEVAFKNTTSGGMSVIHYTSIAFNSSGTPYIAFIEFANGGLPSDSNKYLNYIYRTAADTWTTPVTLTGGVSGYPPSIDFDSADGLHIAWYNNTVGDLEYYFKPLPSAGAGTAPVASFQQDKLAIIRGMSISLTDGSSNTPTTWDWYSPSAASCFDPFANVTDQNPSIFPGTSCKICLIATNAFGTDTSCEGSVWVARPWTVF